MSANRLEGEIPRELGALSRLEILDLSSQGSLPPASSPSPPRAVSPRDAASSSAADAAASPSSSSLGGAIPAELGKLGALRELRLNGLRLAGALPAELVGLARLRVLRLDGDRQELRGTVPPSLARRLAPGLVELGLPPALLASAAEPPPPPAEQPSAAAAAWPTVMTTPTTGRFLRALAAAGAEGGADLPQADAEWGKLCGVAAARKTAAALCDGLKHGNSEEVVAPPMVVARGC